MYRKTIVYVKNNLTPLTWLIAVAATLGSFSLSEIFDLVPCDLCWYQRAMMFPLAFVLGTAVYLKDKRAPYYVLPISLTGAVIALYHTLLQWGIISENALSCSINSACAEPQINWFGFITIPFMAFITFAVISGLMWWQLQMNKSR